MPFSPCTPHAHCRSYRPGHRMHFIHTGLVKNAPWGWRHATVRSIDADNVATFEYSAETGTSTAWHHLDFSVVCPPGTQVRIHERRHALLVGSVVFNLHLIEGIGPVPPPANVAEALAQAPVIVTDLSTGHGITGGW